MHAVFVDAHEDCTAAELASTAECCQYDTASSTHAAAGCPWTSLVVVKDTVGCMLFVDHKPGVQARNAVFRCEIWEKEENVVLMDGVSCHCMVKVKNTHPLTLLLNLVCMHLANWCHYWQFTASASHQD